MIKTKILSSNIPEAFKTLVKTIDEQFTCSIVNDLIRIRTPYLYPDERVTKLNL